MQGYTDRHLRLLYRLLAPSAVLWTEMLKPRDLLTADDYRRHKLLARGREAEEAQGLAVLQLGGDSHHELVCTTFLHSTSLHFTSVHF